MAEQVVWLHAEALRVDHPAVLAAGENARLVHVWDDAALKQAGYSLKRLVFLYETLCALPVEIIAGDTYEQLQQLGAAEILVPASANPNIQAIIHRLTSHVPVRVIEDRPFAVIAKPKDYARFFQYWKQAEKTAFLPGAGQG